MLAMRNSTWLETAELSSEGRPSSRELPVQAGARSEGPAFKAFDFNRPRSYQAGVANPLHRFLILMALSGAATALASDPNDAAKPAAGSPAWLDQAVFYEIYPQTYVDTNGDGIGDLRGIIAKLPYLHDLGITALWLNPIFVSPFRDAGYDVADFYKVAPRYGTNADLQELCATARRLGIRVMLDLVAGHTSDEHPWFRQSQRHESNPYSDWFIWTNSVWVEPGRGLKGVIGEAERDGNYVVNFFSFQPALNYGFAHPDPADPWQQPVDAPGPQAVRAELRKIMAFWFDLGVSGFRVDMAGSLVKNDPDGRATAALWHEVRAWMDRSYPDCALVSEWSNPPVAIPAGFHMDFLLPFAKPGYRALFRPDATAVPIFDRSGQTSILTFLDEFGPLYQATVGKGFIALPTGNHDTVPRMGNQLDSQEMAAAFAFVLTMPTVPFIYYGDEIGLRSQSGLASKEGGFSRTGARTPMQWDDSKNAGYSTAPVDRLYTPIDPAPDRPTVAAELGDPRSTLRTVQRLIALRKTHPALGASGSYSVVFAQRGNPLFVYERSHGAERILVAINPAGADSDAALNLSGAPVSVETLAGVDGAFRSQNGSWMIHLPGASFSIAREVK